MFKTIGVAALTAAMATASLAPAAMAQTATARLRGTVAAVTPSMVTVATREGPKVDVALTQPLTVTALKRVAVGDLKPGNFLLVVSEPGPNDTLKAVSITYTPDSSTMPREGQFPWDSAPNTTMTNAKMSATVAGKDGQDLDLTLNGKTFKLVVPPGTPINSPVPATEADLKVGAPVFLFATKAADGSLSAARVTVGKDGVNPTN